MVTTAVAGLEPVTVPTEQIPEVPAIDDGAMPAFVVAVTRNVAPLTAVAGAPENPTVGVAEPAFTNSCFVCGVP